MSEEQPQPRKAGGFIWKLALTASVVVVPAVAAILIYVLFLGPMFAEEHASAPESADDGRVSPNAVTVTFEESFTTAIMADPNYPASLLMFKVALECANPETANLVERHRPRFNNMLTELHSFRTREELNDPSVKHEIQQEAIRRSNEILERLPVETQEFDLRVTDVFHERFAIQDQI